MAARVLPIDAIRDGPGKRSSSVAGGRQRKRKRGNGTNSVRAAGGGGGSVAAAPLHLTSARTRRNKTFSGKKEEEEEEDEVSAAARRRRWGPVEGGGSVGRSVGGETAFGDSFVRAGEPSRRKQVLVWFFFFCVCARVVHGWLWRVVVSWCCLFLLSSSGAEETAEASSGQRRCQSRRHVCQPVGRATVGRKRETTEEDVSNWFSHEPVGRRAAATLSLPHRPEDGGGISRADHRR